MLRVWTSIRSWLAQCEERLEAAIGWASRHPTPFPLWNVLIWEAIVTLVCVLFIPNEELLIALRIWIISSWSAAGVIFAPDAWRNMFTRTPTSGQKLVLAVGIGAVATTGLSNISVLWRLSPQSWIANSDFSVIFCVAAAFSGMLHCRTPEAIDGVMPRKARLTLGVFVGFGIMIACIVLVMQPRATAWVNSLQPFFPDTNETIFGQH